MVKDIVNSNFMCNVLFAFSQNKRSHDTMLLVTLTYLFKFAQPIIRLKLYNFHRRFIVKVVT